MERTFSWFSQSRRLSKDYERLCATSEHVILIAMIRLMLRRLVRL
jgi:transposase